MVGSANGSDSTHLVEVKLDKLDLNASTTEELQLARVLTRKRQQLVFVGYTSDNDDSDDDEEDGRLHTERHYHDNDRPRYFNTYQNRTDSSGRPYRRLIEEKHFDTDGVCRLDVHFAIGQPYLYRKHYWYNQRLKSESVFWVEDEVTMKCHKTGHWRTYYEQGGVQSEMQYRDGIRFGFCKRYAQDGSIEWVKDYTKQYIDRVDEFNHRKGEVSLTVADACRELGLSFPPPSLRDVNSNYRSRCAPVHPDKTPNPDATERFIHLSRARDVLQEYFATQENGKAEN